MRTVFIASLGLVLLAGFGTATAVTVTASSSDTAELPPAKQAILDQQTAKHDAVAAGKVSAAPKLSYEQGLDQAIAAGESVAGPTSGPPSGVTLTQEAPFPRTEFMSTSMWMGQAATPDGVRWVTVYAGGAEADPDATGKVPIGSVRVFESSSSNAEDEAFVGAIEAPANSGALTLVSGDGHALLLTAADGSPVKFDLASLSFGR